MLCTFIIDNRPACYKKKVKSENDRPDQVQKTKTYTQKRKEKWQGNQKEKTEKKVKTPDHHNGRPNENWGNKLQDNDL